MRSWRTTRRKRRLWLLLVAAVALGFAAAFFVGKHFFSAPESTTPHSKIRDFVPVQAASTRKVHLYFASRKVAFSKQKKERYRQPTPVLLLRPSSVLFWRGLRIPNLFPPSQPVPSFFTPLLQMTVLRTWISTPSSPFYILVGSLLNGSLFIPL